MPFLALRIIAGPNWSQTRNSLGTNVGRALVEDGDDVVLLDLLRDAGPNLRFMCRAVSLAWEGMFYTSL